MATLGVATWSTTAATNATADPNVNWAEGQAPSTVNNSARAMMQSVALWRDDLSGIITGGTTTAYTITSNQTFASLSAMNGMIVSISPHATCGAAPTLAVDGLAAKPLNSVSGTAVAAGSLIAAGRYQFVYVNASNEFVLIGGGGAPAFPTATAMIFVQTAAPTGWTKSTTHNDKALRVVSGTATSGGSTAFTSVFAARTIAEANLPSHTHTGTTASDGAHTHTIPSSAGNLDATGATGYTTTAGSGQATGSNGAHTHTFTTGTGSGSGTAIDFAVQYVDCIIATKD